MKFSIIICFVLSSILVISGAALAEDYVDIGNPTSEGSHTEFNSWGPVEPVTNPGSWGGVETEPYSGGTCRVIWALDDDVPLAEVSMTFSGAEEVVSFQHLDGPADDSFDVYIEGDLVWSYVDSGDSGEFWHVNGFPHTPAGGAAELSVAFVATGEKWTSFDTFGQVAISGVWVSGGPVPAEKNTWGEVKALYR